MVVKGPALREQVYNHIRDRIVSGAFEPGHLMVEVELASDLQVSRTPVSNALVMLRERGLLDDEGGRLHVPVLKLEDVINLYWCRLALDGLASRLAAQKITDPELLRLESYLQAWETPEEEDDLSALWVSDLNFHLMIYQVAHNRHLLRFSQMTTELASVYRRNTIRRLADPFRSSQRTRDDVRCEHQAIFQAIAQRQPDLAEETARQHILNVIQHLETADLVVEATTHQGEDHAS